MDFAEVVLPDTPLQWGLLSVIAGVLIWVVYALLRGNLVPRRVLDERIKERERDWEARLVQALENSKFWREAAEARQNVIVEMMPMLDQIREDHRTTHKLLLSLREIGESRAN